MLLIAYGASAVLVLVAALRTLFDSFDQAYPTVSNVAVAIQDFVTARVRSQRLPSILVILALVMVAPIWLALDLANDVITYVRGNADLRRWRQVRPPEESPKRGILVSERIRRRFNAVASHLLQSEGVNQLVIVAHSQGTVVAIDELCRSSGPQDLDRIPLTLVTMGSPVTHLYQYYDPVGYPSWPASRWDAFFRHVNRWLNLYRIDDFVGTRIDPPSAWTGEFKQQAVGAGGHTDYWTDRRVLQALRDFEVLGHAARSP